MKKMKRLKSIANDQVELEVGECDCGYHFGIDATYLNQVNDFAFNCPACGRFIQTKRLFPTEQRIEHPCRYCGREEDGHWFTPCPSDDCPSHDSEQQMKAVQKEDT